MDAHEPVLLEETVEGLELPSGGRFLDCTFGGGGHSRVLLDRYPEAEGYALDCDPAASLRARELEAARGGRFFFYRQNFENLDGLGLPPLHGILFDLGLSSFQLDEADRGFSFRTDAPLDMRMDNDSGPSAVEFINEAPEEELVRAIRNFGEERHWKRLVRAIMEQRRHTRIKTTCQLADLITDQIGRAYAREKIHPCTRAFQGIRICVNRELDVLSLALPRAFDLLASGGRLAIISFHSLEDRIVKRFFREMSGQPVDRNDHRSQQDRDVRARQITRKPIIPAEAEVQANPRSRSAKLRILKKL